MSVKTMSALEAKNAFGKFLSASQRRPVMVTKNRQEVGAMFSMEDLTSLAQAFLSEPEFKRVQRGEIGLVEALLFQAETDRRIAQSRKEIAEGKGIEVNEAFFEGLRSRVL